MLRVGTGFDVHQLVSGRDLIMGGVKVPHNKGLLGHSDADVLLHAITDAVLGALALGDIGQWFPDTKEEFKGANSVKLLQHVLDSKYLKDWHLVNLDCTIIAQEPKLAAYLPSMRQVIAKLFNVTINEVSIKATTFEKMGSLGRSEGIAAQANLMLQNTTLEK
ncbi:2-C-methyl-D-erythritol 2,4-cyclodiphosphate synthase [Lentisphaera araneosa HTCC2155]|uniref:2-C-methyl-D-erythritol 2,4-cyclodiphosphate synthase n=1 Tax=Lentisphaera araneosa HTCC2155 TaxID=313628 RepID=A6DHR2_9BACT|nr:2-C-methyl-D-erythritol 2,4-cyclodiphosphate synthase [Lentisphaera araneosa]EDM28566.1 2-C-methyl-D-erythritol 2,4-cyclodiphosphate synthase [Lentisphaera araneosa HTCC2155]